MSDKLSPIDAKRVAFAAAQLEEAERAAARADPRQTGLFDKRQARLSVKGGEARRKRSVPVTLAGKPR